MPLLICMELGQCLAAVWQAAVALVAMPQEQPPVKTLTLLAEAMAHRL